MAVAVTIAAIVAVGLVDSVACCCFILSVFLFLERLFVALVCLF